MAGPAICVIVPVYNVAPFLDQCLDSVRAQTWRDLEILCVNDGSTDGSRDLLAAHAAADPRLRVIDQANAGYGAAMNAGLAAARGEYVAIVESDDFLDAGTLRWLLGVARTHDADVVKANYYHHWSAPVPRDELVRVVGAAEAGRVLTDPVGQSDILYQPPSIWSALYRRGFLEAADARFLPTPGASYQDASFAFKVWANAPRTYLLREAFLHYRQDNAASSIHSLGKVTAVMAEFDEMARYLTSRPGLPARLEAARQLMRYNAYLWNYDRLDDGLRGEFLEAVARQFRDEAASGTLDLSAFDPLRATNVRAIMASPARFHAAKAAARGHRVATALSYGRLGGPRLALDLAADRLRRRSYPRYPADRAERP